MLYYQIILSNEYSPEKHAVEVGKANNRLKRHKDSNNNTQPQNQPSIINYQKAI